MDNVFFLGRAHMLHTDSFHAIAQPFFYGRPLEMEFVSEDTLLGFTISTLQRTLTFRQPPHLTLIRSNRAAGSPHMAPTQRPHCWIIEWTASIRRCWGTELKKPTRSSLVACKGMSAGFCVR